MITILVFWNCFLCQSLNDFLAGTGLKRTKQNKISCIFLYSQHQSLISLTLSFFPQTFKWIKTYLVCLQNRTSFNFFNFFPNLSCCFMLNTSENWHLVKIFWKLQNFVLVLVWPKAGCIVSILIPNTNCYFRWLWSCNID